MLARIHDFRLPIWNMFGSPSQNQMKHPVKNTFSSHHSAPHDTGFSNAQLLLPFSCGMVRATEKLYDIEKNGCFRLHQHETH